VLAAHSFYPPGLSGRRSPKAKQLPTTFEYFFTTAVLVAINTLALLRSYPAACKVIPPTRNAGEITQALAAPWRNNFSPLFTPFRNCLLRGKKHIGAQEVYYSAACMLIPPTENAGGITQALAAPRQNNFSPLFTTSHHARWRCCNVTPPPAK
jgi:hypothetical protein